MGANPRTKGASGEREAARLLTGWAQEIGIKLDLERNLEQVRHGGADVNGVPGLEVEVKRREAVSTGQWWRQVCTAAKKTGKVPLLMWRQNRKPWQFMVRQHVAIYGKQTGVVELDITMDTMQAKKWFQYHIWLYTQERVEE